CSSSRPAGSGGSVGPADRHRTAGVPEPTGEGALLHRDWEVRGGPQIRRAAAELDAGVTAGSVRAAHHFHRGGEPLTAGTGGDLWSGSQPYPVLRGGRGGPAG